MSCKHAAAIGTEAPIEFALFTAVSCSTDQSLFMRLKLKKGAKH